MFPFRVNLSNLATSYTTSYLNFYRLPCFVCGILETGFFSKISSIEITSYFPMFSYIFGVKNGAPFSYNGDFKFWINSFS